MNQLIKQSMTEKNYLLTLYLHRFKAHNSVYPLSKVRNEVCSEIKLIHVCLLLFFRSGNSQMKTSKTNKKTGNLDAGIWRDTKIRQIRL